MSAEDPDLPVHRVSRVEDRERLLAEAMAHAEALEKQYKVIPADPPLMGRWKGPLAMVTFALALLLGLFPPGWLAGVPAPVPSEGDLDRGLRASIYLLVHQVEVFRVREGRLPVHMSELPAQLPSLVLIRSNSRVYQIQGRKPDGTLVVYDSARPSPAFAAAAAWLAADSP